MMRFKYTGQSGQKVGFGLVETGQVYEVPDETAPILQADTDFVELTGKAAEEGDAVPGWPEAASAPATDTPVPPVTPPSTSDLDRAIISFTSPSPPSAKGRRSTAKK